MGLDRRFLARSAFFAVTAFSLSAANIRPAAAMDDSDTSIGRFTRELESRNPSCVIKDGPFKELDRLQRGEIQGYKPADDLRSTGDLLFDYNKIQIQMEAQSIDPSKERMDTLSSKIADLYQSRIELGVMAWTKVTREEDKKEVEGMVSCFTAKTSIGLKNGLERGN